MAEMQLGYVLQLIEPMTRAGYRQLEPKPAALDAFEAERREAAVKTVWMTGCSSWYLDKDGIPAGWTLTYQRFRDEMAEPRLDDFIVR
jgi:hypothetical protein